MTTFVPPLQVQIRAAIRDDNIIRNLRQLLSFMFTASITPGLGYVIATVNYDVFCSEELVPVIS